jgi:hypothetical protein
MRSTSTSVSAKSGLGVSSVIVSKSKNFHNARFDAQIEFEITAEDKERHSKEIKLEIQQLIKDI